MKNKIYVMVVTVVALFSGCAKDGATGPTGPAGTNGTNGSANVTVQTSSVNTWSSNSIMWFADIAVPTLTSAVQSSGTVQVFLSVNSGITWTALPTVFYSPAIYWMSYTTQTSSVEVQWYINGLGIASSPNTFFSATCMFKVVVIPPAARIANPTINWNNYQEIKTAFNFKD